MATKHLSEFEKDRIVTDNDYELSSFCKKIELFHQMIVF